MSMIIIGGKNSNSKITNIKDEFVQENSVDVRIDKLFAIRPDTFVLEKEDEVERVHRSIVELKTDDDDFWLVQPGVYEFVSNSSIQMGRDECGWIITQSTLNKNGCYVSTRLFESGFDGLINGTLVVNGGPLQIQRGACVGQFVCQKAENTSI